MAEPVFQATHTHLYPGATGRVVPTPGIGGPLPCAIEFTDGTMVSATVEATAPDAALLRVDAYRTGRGTSVASKAWRLSLDRSGEAYRVIGRVQAGQ